MGDNLAVKFRYGLGKACFEGFKQSKIFVLDRLNYSYA